MSETADPKLAAKLEGFKIALSEHLLEGAIHTWPSLWKRLGNLESGMLRSQMDAVSIDRPIFVAGLARSGSTILLETLARSAAVASHRYSDFPAIFTPYWWSRIQQSAPGGSQPEKAIARAHADGLMVTQNSPEAMEEPLWMAHFPDAHHPAKNQVLSADTSNPAFESFYRDHIRKLLLIRGRNRYLAKGNYNLTRLPYLLNLFPNARFVAPVRQPENHIASLMKQHRLFVAGENRFPRSLAHMRRVGHFEFGIDRRPINAGDPRTIEEVVALWKQGDEIRGWARYWAHLHRWLAMELRDNSSLRGAVQVVRFEDLCSTPLETLAALFSHCDLAEEHLVEELAPTIQAPSYYRPDFSDEDLEIIAEETADVAEMFGYTSLACQDDGVEQRAQLLC